MASDNVTVYFSTHLQNTKAFVGRQTRPLSLPASRLRPRICSSLVGIAEADSFRYDNIPASPRDLASRFSFWHILKQHYYNLRLLKLKLNETYCSSCLPLAANRIEALQSFLESIRDDPNRICYKET